MRRFLNILGIILLPVLLSGAGPRPESSTALDLTGALRNGNHRMHTVTLRAGYSYTFAGACDRDCDDLDLQLFDENGNLIDEDLLPDDVPVVTVSPSWTGVFYVKVIMASCYVSPCRYAVVV